MCQDSPPGKYVLGDCCSKARRCDLFQTTMEFYELVKSLSMNRMKHKCPVDVQALKFFQRCIERGKALTEPDSLVSGVGGHAQNGQDECFMRRTTGASP